MPTIRIESRVDSSLNRYLASSGLDKTIIFDIIRDAAESCKTICTYKGIANNLIFDLTRIDFYLNILETSINSHASRYLRRTGIESDPPRIRARCVHHDEKFNGEDIEALDFFFYRGDHREEEPDTRILGHRSRKSSYH